MPFKATLALTYRCPYRCDYCGVWKREEEELSPDEIVKAFSGMQQITWLDVTGGEIFLRDDLMEICTRLAGRLKNLSFFHFPTSGAFPDQAATLARTVAGMGIRVVVTVSFEGPETEHDRLRGLKGAFASAVETFSRLKEIENVSTYAGVTFTRENISLMPDRFFDSLAKFFPGLKKRDLHFNIMQTSDHFFSNLETEKPSQAEVVSALKRVLKWKGMPLSPFELLEMTYRSLALFDLRGRKRFLPRCAALKASFFVSPGGYVYPCHIWGEPVGRVDGRNDLVSLLRSDRWKALRKKVAERSCPHCWTPCEAYPSIIVQGCNPLQLDL